MRGMKVAGMITMAIHKHSNYINHCVGCVTNGEFNSLRCKGSGRPLSVLQVRSDVRALYSKKSVLSMWQMLTPKGTT